MNDSPTREELLAKNEKLNEDMKNLVVLLWLSLWKRGPLRVSSSDVEGYAGVDRVLNKAPDPNRPGGFIITSKEVTTTIPFPTNAESIPTPQATDNEPV